MLHLEARLHAECGALFDREGVLIQVLERTGFGEVDDDVRAASHFQREGEDDAGALVVRVGEGVAGAQT